jgi:hypothetical protein
MYNQKLAHTDLNGNDYNEENNWHFISYFGNALTGNCERCDSSCKACSGISTNCTVCAYPYFLAKIIGTDPPKYTC